MRPMLRVLERGLVVLGQSGHFLLHSDEISNSRVAGRIRSLRR